jgi:transitional endoplasmic reticulum ATPase
VTDIDEWSGAPGQLARVRRVVGGTRIYVEFPNASLAWVGTPEPVAFQDGQIVLLFPDRVEPAPPELWREDPMVSVVRIKNSETTVVEYAGQIRSIPTNDVEYEVGNTVEFLPSGVTKVLDSTPLSILELPEIGDKAISEVISPK